MTDVSTHGIERRRNITRKILRVFGNLPVAHPDLGSSAASGRQQESASQPKRWKARTGRSHFDHSRIVSESHLAIFGRCFISNRYSMQIALLIVCSMAGYLPAPKAVAEPIRENLVLWLDASTISATAADGRVGQWLDLSGRENHLSQKQLTARPRLEHDGLAGLAVVRFGGNSFLTAENFSGFTIRDQPFHAVFVMRAEQGGTHATPGLMEWQPIGGDLTKPATVKQHGFWIGAERNGVLQLVTHYGDAGQAIAPALTGKPHLAEVVYEGAQEWVHYLDGIRNGAGLLDDRDFHGFTEPLRFSLGQLFGSQGQENDFRGVIAEVLIYDRVLTATEQNNVRTYLRDKWSLELTIAKIPSFEKDVLPIFESHCFECHDGPDPEADLDVRTVSSMLRGGQRGPVLSPGHSERSEIYAQISSHEMPPSDALSAEAIATIRRWIDVGAPSDQPVRRPASKDLVSAQDREFWAFQPLTRTSVISMGARDHRRSRTGADSFILHKLREHGLTYAPDASRETLVRRLAFDLTGLPPTSSQVRRFVADRRPDAWSRLIDSILASPHFGERWARSWLDWSGYVDVYGKDNDFAIIKPLSGRWRYRDYVIRSFNDDKPIDQFILEQLAGDELVDWRNADHYTPRIRELLTATGFLLCGDDDTDQPELNTPPIRHHVLQHTAEIVANNLFALTVQCAKCHDHKYEAISQVDYYRWLANFAPIFNPQRWVTSTEHGIANVSSHQRVIIDSQNAQLDDEIKRLESARSHLESTYRNELFEQRIHDLPLAAQDEARTAFLAPIDKRTGKQNSLLVHHQLNFPIEQIRNAFRSEDRQTQRRLDQEIALLKEQYQTYGTIQVAVEQNPPSPTFVLRRGEVSAPGTAVEAGNFTILAGIPEYRAASPGPRGKTSGRRLAIARQITDARSVAGTLVARVFVNRVWQELLGVGIVPTSDNFGASGDRPTHPALLDWLTEEFIRHGWRLKPLVRTILLSTAYRQDSVRADLQPALRSDPGNQLLWRSRLKRLTSEQLRDRILTVSGDLKRQLEGQPVPLHVRSDGKIVIDMDAIPTSDSHLRRSIYVLNRRNYHLSLLTTFDQPFLTTNCTVRKPSAVVTQSLTMLNDEFVIHSAHRFAQHVLHHVAARTPDELVCRAFQQGLGRSPDHEEHAICVDLYTKHLARFQTLGEDDQVQMALAQICHLIFKTNEFLYIR